jgi:hypothetical protein
MPSANPASTASTSIRRCGQPTDDAVAITLAPDERVAIGHRCGVVDNDSRNFAK